MDCLFILKSLNDDIEELAKKKQVTTGVAAYISSRINKASDAIEQQIDYYNSMVRSNSSVNNTAATESIVISHKWIEESK